MAYFEYYKSLLDEKNKKIYSILLTKIKQGVDGFTINVPFTTKLFNIHEAIRYDHPEIYFTSDTFSISGNEQKTKCTVGRTIDKKESSMYAAKIVEIIKKEFARALKMDDYNKTKYVYEWFMNNVKYSKETTNCGNIIGPFIEKVSSCQGVSFSAKLIFDYLKINSIIVSGDLLVEGKKEPHAWNMVQINNNFYHFDATHGLNGLHSLLNVTDMDISKSHFYEQQKYPLCNHYEDNYYSKENLVIKNESGIIDSFLKQTLKKQNSIEFKITGTNDDLSQYLLNRASLNLAPSLMPKKIRINYDINRQVYIIKIDRTLLK